MKFGEVMDFRRNWVAFCLLGVTLLIASCSAEEEKKTAHLEEGNAFLVKGELEDAEKAFLRAIALDNRYKEAFVQLGIVQMRRGEFRAAFASFTKAAEIDPQDLDVQLRLATFHMLGRDFPRALDILNNVLAKDPGNIEALFLKGSFMVQQKNLNQA
jgi:tetratricopeptide (TPR) repeat protein